MQEQSHTFPNSRGRKWTKYVVWQVPSVGTIRNPLIYRGDGWGSELCLNQNLVTSGQWLCNYTRSLLWPAGGAGAAVYDLDPGAQLPGSEEASPGLQMPCTVHPQGLFLVQESRGGTPALLPLIRTIIRVDRSLVITSDLSYFPIETLSLYSQTVWLALPHMVWSP